MLFKSVFAKSKKRQTGRHLTKKDLEASKSNSDFKRLNFKD